MSTTFDDVIRLLERRWTGDLPGADAQILMAPLRANALERLRVRDRACREAGVLMALLPIDETPHIVVTVRRHDLPEHAGQVSLPGGRREEGESLCDAALREAHEEVDLQPSEVNIIGGLTPLFVPPSNYCVYPYLGYVPYRPPLRPHDYEVERIVEVPLPALLEDSTVRREEWTIRGESVLVPFFEVADLKIWGATAMMLSELVVLVRGSV